MNISERPTLLIIGADLLYASFVEVAEQDTESPPIKQLSTWETQGPYESGFEKKSEKILGELS